MHLIGDTDECCEMRSRFWLGDAYFRWLSENNFIDRFLASPDVRSRMLPAGPGLLTHCAKEMNHLITVRHY